MFIVTTKNLDSLSCTFDLKSEKKKYCLMTKKNTFWDYFQLHLGRTVHPETDIPGGPGVRPAGADQ